MAMSVAVVGSGYGNSACPKLASSRIYRHGEKHHGFGCGGCSPDRSAPLPLAPLLGDPTKNRNALQLRKSIQF